MFRRGRNLSTLQLAGVFAIYGSLIGFVVALIDGDSIKVALFFGCPFGAALLTIIYYVAVLQLRREDRVKGTASQPIGQHNGPAAWFSRQTAFRQGFICASAGMMLGQFIGVTLTNSLVGLLAGALIETVVGIVSYSTVVKRILG